MMLWKTTLVSVILLVGLSGCASIGPYSVARDRFDYISAISDSWKSQMLLNLVKIPYGDAPVFLDVTSVINQYVLETEASVASSWQTPLSTNSPNAYAIGGSGRYTDRPTITYSPLLGEKFARRLMAPIPPAAILNLIQAGYPVDLVLRTTVHSINGIHSRFGAAARRRAADPQFYPLIEKMRKVQLSGAIGMRVKETADGMATLWVFRQHPSPQTEADVGEIRKILGLDPETKEISVVYSSVASNDKEIALLTRTMLEILIDLGSYIHVPASSVEERRTYPTPPQEMANGAPVAPLIRISSSPQEPPDAFAVIPYRNEWYWIDDKDFRSKGFFSFIMFLFTLTETEDKQGAPIITIPAG
jgi:hypothetical protein